MASDDQRPSSPMSVLKPQAATGSVPHPAAEMAKQGCAETDEQGHGEAARPAAQLRLAGMPPIRPQTQSLPHQARPPRECLLTLQPPRLAAGNKKLLLLPPLQCHPCSSTCHVMWPGQGGRLQRGICSVCAARAPARWWGRHGGGSDGSRSSRGRRTPFGSGKISRAGLSAGQPSSHLISWRRAPGF
jgi:hypothetical protein